MTVLLLMSINVFCSLQQWYFYQIIEACHIINVSKYHFCQLRCGLLRHRVSHCPQKTLKSVIFWRFSHFLLTMLHQTLFYTMSSLLDQPCDIFGLKSSITNSTVHFCVLFDDFTNQTRIVFILVFKTIFLKVTNFNSVIH